MSSTHRVLQCPLLCLLIDYLFGLRERARKHTQRPWVSSQVAVCLAQLYMYKFSIVEQFLVVKVRK